MTGKNESFRCRTAARLRYFNGNALQMKFLIKRWQVSKCPIGIRPRIEAIPSLAAAPNKCWSTEFCRVWSGRDGWTNLALVSECHTGGLLGRQLSRFGKATTAVSIIEHALINRFGTLGRVTL